MTFEQTIDVVGEDTVAAECGPMRLLIRAWAGGQPQVKPARQAAQEAFGYLERIATCRPLLSRPWPEIENPPQDELARRMLASVSAIGDADLTPLAAVAGTIADAVADRLVELGAARVIVDNGGDIAVRLAEGESVNAGIRPQVASPQISHVIHLDAAYSTWGVTTSGMGGRSFTRGIASAVTVLAAKAAVADAAATAIANACFVEDEAIIQLPADRIDPNSDLGGINVTTAVGRLSAEKIRLAIHAARKKADRLSRKNAIIGAFIALGNVFVITDGLQPYVAAVGGNAG
jgi:ApbE superfamily uncharacterized protein (UPF0280 family)